MHKGARHSSSDGDGGPVDRDGLTAVPEAGPSALGGAQPVAAARQLVPCPALAPVPHLLRRPGRVCKRLVPAADGHRLARHRAHWFAHRPGPGPGGWRSSVSVVRPVGRRHRRPRGPAPAPPGHAGGLLRVGRPPVGACRFRGGQRARPGRHRRRRGCRPDRRLAGRARPSWAGSCPGRTWPVQSA